MNLNANLNVSGVTCASNVSGAVETLIKGPFIDFGCVKAKTEAAPPGGWAESDFPLGL